MEAYAIAKHIRMSAYKVRRILALIRKKDALESKNILKYVPGAASPRILKVLNSAVANLKQKNTTLRDEDITVKTAVADEGQSIRRIISRSQGRAEQIKKRTCHIKIVVSND
ncbi:50S ribosomal protein L22 [Candidatus Dependentiae bacterium]|nr:50S ribosomal protein L22 [Candidatus Dependentiae bacterium]